MAFVPKVWFEERVLDADLIRMEDGIDDIHNTLATVAAGAIKGKNFTSDVIMENAIEVQGKESGGTARNLARVTAGNIAEVGDAAIALKFLGTTTDLSGAGALTGIVGVTGSALGDTDQHTTRNIVRLIPAENFVKTSGTGTVTKNDFAGGTPGIRITLGSVQDVLIRVAIPTQPGNAGDFDGSAINIAILAKHVSGGLSITAASKVEMLTADSGDTVLTLESTASLGMTFGSTGAFLRAATGALTIDVAKKFHILQVRLNSGVSMEFLITGVEISWPRDH